MNRGNLAVHMIDLTHTQQFVEKFLDLQNENQNLDIELKKKQDENEDLRIELKKKQDENQDLDVELKKKRSNLDDVTAKLNRMNQNEGKRLVCLSKYSF